MKKKELISKVLDLIDPPMRSYEISYTVKKEARIIIDAYSEEEALAMLTNPAKRAPAMESYEEGAIIEEDWSDPEIVEVNI